MTYGWVAHRATATVSLPAPATDLAAMARVEVQGAAELV